MSNKKESTKISLEVYGIKLQISMKKADVTVTELKTMLSYLLLGAGFTEAQLNEIIVQDDVTESENTKRNE
jgi:hypothetical protein